MTAGSAPSVALDVAELDWSLFGDIARRRFFDGLDEVTAQGSETIQRIVDLASTVAASQYAQLSLIDATQFVPASSGLEYGDDAQHSPHGESLCAVTMALGEPLVVENAPEHEWVRDLPPVAGGTVGSYLGVPVRSELGVCVGALCVFDGTRREWTPNEVRSLEELGSMVGREIDLIRSTGARVDTVNALTEIVLDLVAHDTRSSQATGIEGVASRYRPAAGADVGGDWVDVVRVADDRLSFTLGDCAGHGLEAVAVMSIVRNAAHTLLLEGRSPGEVVSGADHLLSDRRAGAMATAVHGHLDRSTGRLLVASAGHVPLLRVRDGAAEFLDVPPSPPLGAFGLAGGHRAVTHELQLRPGDSLVAFTDGLVERRNESVDVGLAALADATASIWASVPEIDARADRLLDWSHGTTGDDVCLLVIDV